MATLNQSPLATSVKTLPASPISVPKSITVKSLRSSFSGIKLHTPTLTVKPKKPAGGAVMIDTAAASYASALADVAKSNGSLAATNADIEKIDKLFSNPSVFGFFTNPIIDLEKKRKMLDEISVAEKLKPTTANFLNILVDVKRIDMVLEIVKEFEIFYNKMTDTELAVVTSVVKLDSQHLAQIAQTVQKLTGAKNVRIKTVIDPSLLAGFTIRYGNSGSKLIDMSVKTQLDEIAAQLDIEEMVGSLAG